MHKLNHRPHKILNFKTPDEIFFAEREQDAAGLRFGAESATDYRH
ncbi:MAG: hypothetical protein Q7T96_00675 [Methylobacter sp.]|nr:hypothetical protein [Methylobacter sp.]